MGNEIYIKGNLIIEVESTLFKFKHISCGEKLSDEVVTCMGDLMVTDANNTSSFFNSYYVAGNVATKKVGAMIGYFTIESAYRSAYKEIWTLIELIATNTFEEMLLPTFYKHIYMGAISVLETFLSDTLFSWVFSNRDYFEKYLNIQNSKISLKDVPKTAKNIEDAIYNNINHQLYHNLVEVKNIYQKNMNITFPPICEMEEFINKRHDLVHRNGKDLRGIPVNIDLDELDQMLEKVVAFIEGVKKCVEKK